MPDPPLRGVVVPLASRHGEQARALAMEAMSALRALRAEPALAGAVPGDADFVLLVLSDDPPPVSIPDLAGRAAAAVAVADPVAEGRVAVASARRRLRGAGAALGARELVLSPSEFGVLGLESDNQRDRLHELVQALLHDADRLRLKREGWEDPEERT
ncbi:MAG TPA: hypothetical protein VHH36_02845 [Candidatus Thermoplasmatota archaeon]|nr:hypothetical protein [Candidatus Thermoplasmatota archaeon]